MSLTSLRVTLIEKTTLQLLLGMNIFTCRPCFEFYFALIGLFCVYVGGVHVPMWKSEENLGFLLALGSDPDCQALW